MAKFFDNMKKTSDWLISIYGILSIVITLSIGGYISYISIIESINNNTKQIETTQMLILKSVIKDAEKNPCPMSDAAWDDYLTNFTTLYELKIKYHKLPKNAPWQPIERITKRSDKCKD